MRAATSVLLLACSALVLGCATNEEPAQEPARQGPTPEERERVRRFWERFEAAETLRRDGQWSDASAAYAEALSADPEHEGALYGRANCLLELDRHAEARPHLERLVALNPLSQRAHVQLAYLRSAPGADCCFDLEAARRELERAAEINREETGALMRLAEVDLALGRAEDAAELLEQVRRANAQSVGAPWLLAWLAHRDGLGERAALLLDEALVRARGPELPSAVPAEGDTRGDHRLVESTLPAKRVVPPVWEGLATRQPQGPWTKERTAAELARLDPALTRVAEALSER